MSNQTLEQKPKSEVFLIIKNTLILFAITAIAGLLLSIVNSMTADAIAAQKIIQRDNALNAVLPDASFEEIKIEKAEEYQRIQGIYQAKDSAGNLAGYAFMLTNKGYGGTITLAAGISAGGVISGMDIITHSETPGLGANADTDKFKEKLKGKQAETLTVVKGNNDGQNVDALSGATITSAAVTDAVNEAIAYYNNQLKGGK
ncbi:RnfABCDGE type electron transport complex subunit G [Clostridiales bacterium COT073_COT-073]|nr:RnfABCDGE type electron transport complex subunit G [Clostridiales bacterium COT073_COT-073]